MQEPTTRDTGARSTPSLDLRSQGDAARANGRLGRRGGLASEASLSAEDNEPCKACSVQ